MTEPTFQDGVDHLAPRFELYFGTPPQAEGGTQPMPESPDDARSALRQRIDERILGESEPRLYPLAGAWGDREDQTTRDVIQVTFEESIEGDTPLLSKVVFTLFNVYDAEHRTYRYSDARREGRPLIDYGQSVALRIGYPMEGQTTLEPVFEGLITTIEASFPADGESSLSVTAVDYRDRLRAARPTESFRSDAGTVEEIAAEVCGLAGLRLAAGQQTDLPASERQAADNDLSAFLNGLVRGHAGLELSALGDVVFVESPSDHEEPAVELVYRRGLKSFDPKLDLNGRPESVLVQSRDPRTGRRVQGTATLQSLQDTGFAPARSELVLGQLQGQGGSSDRAPRQHVVTDHSLQTDTECERLARTILKRELDQAFTATAHTLGDPRLRIRKVVTVSGVGRFDGDYLITRTRHVFGEQGYQTELGLRRNTGLESSEEEAA